MEKKTKVLIADDSALMRRTMRKMLEKMGLDVVTTARDGVDAIEKAEKYRPDVITLDINMPRMDGLTALKKLLRKDIAPIVMVSSLTQAGANTTLEALELGAFDCVGKPGGTVSSDMTSAAIELERKIREAASSGIMKRLRTESGRSSKRRPSPGILSKAKSTIRSTSRKTSRTSSRTSTRTTGITSSIMERAKAAAAKEANLKAIAIGISTGGPKTIFDVLPNLPGNINAAIFLVQHMPANFTSQFAQRIDRSCLLKCVEVRAGMTVEPGTIYLGKGGSHLKLVKKSNNEIVIRCPTRPPHLFIPSVDIMMESVLEVFGNRTIGVIMTGMGDDGARSMVKIKQAGGVTIAESEESSIVWGMPGETVRMGGAQIVKPSWEIANSIIDVL